MRIIRMFLGGCWLGELRGRLTFGTPIHGRGHDYAEQADGSLWCERCGGRR